MDRIDVLIVTAVAEEYTAVLAAGGGEQAWSPWRASTGLTVASREFAVKDGVLRVAVTQALGMGGAAAVAAAADLLRQHEVRCLAMCGVCAGKRGDVALGDVIIADRVWQYGAGKRKVEVIGGQEVVKEEEDIEMYRLHPPAWKQSAERFVVDPGAAWLADRPRSWEAQGDWILERVLRGADPVTDAESKTKCADFDKALSRLWKKGLLADGTLELTGAGKGHIRRVLLLNRGALPEQKPFEKHVGPMASGGAVAADGKTFGRLEGSVRKVLGLEMEAAAIEMLAYMNGLPFSIVMKGVMDHADPDKSDNFKTFAARASAEVLLAFVQQHVPPRGAGEDPVLEKGTSGRLDRKNPSTLLSARHAVVPFHGRAELLKEMRAWCMGGEGVEVRLVHADGGMGKTRFAIELCKSMRDAGWRAGFLRDGKALADLLERDKPALAVIDYAESRQGLREMLRAVADRKQRIRILLLARNADQWWADLIQSDGYVGDLLRGHDPIELGSVTPDKETMFREAASAFAECPYLGAIPRLVDKRYDRVLYIHAAALAAAQGRPVEIDKLMEETLDHEERFWQEALRSRGDRARRDAVHKMRLAVAGLTLRGGVSRYEDTVLDDEELNLLLRDLYPGRAPKVIGGLEPDLLGEAMVWRALSGEGAGAGPYLDKLFDGADSETIRTGFTVLGRLSENHKEAEVWIARILDRDVNERAMDAFEAAKVVGEQTAHAAIGMVLAKALEREGKVRLAEQLEKELPRPDQTVALRELGRWVLEKRLVHLPQGREEERARLLSNLSLWQDALGHREAALASTEKAVALYRVLASTRPEAFQPDLAANLTNLGVLLCALGQKEKAIAFAEQAVASYRDMASGRPDAFRSLLANGLNNLGIVQDALGRREEALVSTEESVSLCRGLASICSKGLQPDLAASLNNLSNRQHALGRWEEALASAEEAVAIYHALALMRPEAFQPDLAMSLNGLAGRQHMLGHREAALASTEEAVAIFRRLAFARPEAFQSTLAVTLSNLSRCHIVLGHPEEALAAAEEAVDTLWPSFLRYPAAFANQAGNYLKNLRDRLSALSAPDPPDLADKVHAYQILTAAAP